MSAAELARRVLDQFAPDRGQSPEPGLTELLEASPAAHRRAVAAELGLDPSASAEQIGAAVRDGERIAATVSRLSTDARRLTAQAAFRGDASVHQSWNGRPSHAAGELERHGLAFAFRQSYATFYHVPHDLHVPLADALAAPFAAASPPPAPHACSRHRCNSHTTWRPCGPASHAHRCASGPTVLSTNATSPRSWRRCPQSSCTVTPMNRSRNCASRSC